MDTVVALSFWQTQEQAESAVRLAASWVKDNIAEMVVSMQSYVGDLSFFTYTGSLGDQQPE